MAPRAADFLTDPFLHQAKDCWTLSRLKAEATGPRGTAPPRFYRKGLLGAEQQPDIPITLVSVGSNIPLL